MGLKWQRQRHHWHIHVARSLVARYGVICLEKLDIEEMRRRPEPKQDEAGAYLPTGAEATAMQRVRIGDMAWYAFGQVLRQQARKAGVCVVEVEAAHTTQTCSDCGKITERKVMLTDREFACTHCGTVLDRKVNAARVVLQRRQEVRSERM